MTDYKADFEKVFNGFIENSLPKDDLYLQLEKNLDKRKDKAREEAKLILDEENTILPNPNQSELQAQNARTAKIIHQQT